MKLTEQKEKNHEMGDEETSPRILHLPLDLLEEILLGLPLKSIIKFKSVSKQWRSILESKRFAERRMNLQKKGTKILAAGGQSRTVPRQFERDEEVELFCLQHDDAKRPSLTCDGLVCIPIPGCVNILNPSTGELVSFPSGLDPVNDYGGPFYEDPWWNAFPGYWSMGFGRDIVDGSYKVVRIFCDTNQFDILNVNTGEWRKLSPPPYYVEPRRKSACVNGSIYWLQVSPSCRILALDLHTQVFRHVPIPPYCNSVPGQLVNLDDRLTITTAYGSFQDNWDLQIWSMDVQEETWTKTYSIRLSVAPQDLLCRLAVRPLAVSKQGHLLFHDNEYNLFRYYPETDSVRCLDAHICVISPFVENLFPLPRPNIKPASFHPRPISWIPKFVRQVRLPDVLLITGLVFLLTRHYFVSSSL